MGLAVLAHVKAHVGEHRLEVGGVDVVQPLLVVRLGQAEDAEVGPQGNHARRGSCPRGGGGGMFLDSRLDEPVGALFREIPRLHGTGEVTVEDENGCPAFLFVILLPYVGEGRAEGGTVVRLLVSSVGDGFSRVEIRLRGRHVPSCGDLCRPAEFPRFVEKRGVTAELLHGLDIEFRPGSLSVEFGRILHEGHPPAHDGPAQDHRGPVAGRTQAESRVEFPEGVAVAFQHIPPVSPPEGGDVRGHDRLEGSRDLDVVPVHESCEIGQVFLDGDPAGLGALALGLASVPHENVGPPAVLPGLLGQGEPHARGKALAKVAAPPVDTRHIPFDVSLEGGTALAEMSDCVHGRKETPLRQGGVGSRRCMAVADGNIVPVDIGAVLWRQVSHTVDGQVHFRAREGSGGMAAVRQGDHGDGISPAACGGFLKGADHGVIEGADGKIPQCGKVHFRIASLNCDRTDYTQDGRKSQEKGRSRRTARRCLA
ncbi:hypothetical protein SDC9_57650 [bioreactor metagenome]|uniref:Uncharacterized protein n=1 Tax=bioreactor metagenome TaxID=1076179 RepID=A0A644X671_9ZZZZ